MPASDLCFAMIYKVYTTLSGRRFGSDRDDAFDKGLISKKLSRNTIHNAMQDAQFTAILTSMVERTAIPLAAFESCFAMDSTGFSTLRYRRWFDQKYGKGREEREWVKIHIACGINTNIVAAVQIGEPNTNDKKMFPRLLRTLKRNFKISEVLGDKGYCSRKNFELVGSLGATPYIDFVANSTGRGKGIWDKMFHLLQLHR